MRILHTADWHLGQRLNGHERFEEHQQFLDWLLASIEENSVEALVVAGDVFDTANPTPKAQRQYYGFLAQLSRSKICRDVIIVGGNHDNPNLLNAPKTLLKALNIHIVGAVPEQVEEQCVLIPSSKEPRLVVAAVPFLREGDIRQSALGETVDEMDNRVRQGIAAHYEAVAKCVKGYREANLPVLVTGHLFAQGAAASADSERTIHIGNLGQVTADIFSDVFDYVALGHLHKHQIVGGYEHIRYSGSPIPLSFSESDYKHQVLILDFEGKQYPGIRSLTVPVGRKLLRAKGSLDEVKHALRNWDNSSYRLPAWADVIVFSAESLARANDDLDELNKELSESLFIVSRRFEDRNLTEGSDDEFAPSDAENLLKDPSKVFARLLDKKNFEESRRNELTQTFDELLSLDDHSTVE